MGMCRKEYQIILKDNSTGTSICIEGALLYAFLSNTYEGETVLYQGCIKSCILRKRVLGGTVSATRALFEMFQQRVYVT